MDKALLARVEKQAWIHRFSRGWPLLLFLITAGGTLLSVVAIERAEQQRQQLELDRNMTEIASALQRRAAENVAVLKAGATLFSLRDEVSPQEFNEFTRGLIGNGDLHGSLGLGWAQLIPASEVAAFEARKSADVPGDRFVVWPRSAEDRPAAAPVVYINPQTPANRNAVGFDMCSDEARRLAMDTAVRLGQPVASGMVRLAQDKGAPGRPGFLIYTPVFRRGAGASRRIVGFVFSPFRAAEFLDSAAELYSNRGVEIAIYDDVKDPQHRLALRQVAGDNGMTIQRPIMVAQRRWIVEASLAKPAWLSPLARATLAFGAILSIFVLMLTRMLTKRAAEDRMVLEWLTRQSSIRTSLTRELNHRVKNTLANVLSIVSLTRRRARDIDDLAESLIGRVRALSATHDILSQTDWSAAPISQVIRSELAPYMQGDEAHVDMVGPDISLAANEALSLGLAIHELATNAAKYGALSSDSGKVVVTWRLLSPQTAEVHWREEGGPPVKTPEGRGFGRDLIEKIVASELKSDVELSFPPEGVECRLLVPVRRLADFTLRSGKPE